MAEFHSAGGVFSIKYGSLWVDLVETEFAGFRGPP